MIVLLFDSCTQQQDIRARNFGTDKLHISMVNMLKLLGNFRELRVFCGLLGAVLLLPGIIGASVSPVSAQEITFEEILHNPNDIQLNLEYARQEVASGRLQQAASALERILLQKPNWDSVRLFYGIVLYRLGDMQGAERELTLLEGRGLSPSQEKDRIKYLARTRHENSDTRISSQITVGGRLDTNPGRISSDPAFQTPGLDEEDDVAVTASTQFRVESNIPTGQGDYWFFQSNSNITEFKDTENADLFLSKVQTGFAFHGKDVKFVPYAFFGKSLLQHENFRNSWGAGARGYWAINPQIELFAAGEYADQNYHLTSFSPVGSQRDGTKVTGRGGIIWRPTDSQKFTFEGKVSRKDASFDGFSYDHYSIEVKSLTLFGEGRFLTLTAHHSDTQYDQPDLFNSFSITRQDDRLYARAAVGAPLQTLLPDFELPELLEDIVAQVGVNWTKQDSTINTLDIENLSGDIMFTKRIEY